MAQSEHTHFSLLKKIAITTYLKGYCIAEVDHTQQSVWQWKMAFRLEKYQ